MDYESKCDKVSLIKERNETLQRATITSSDDIAKHVKKLWGDDLLIQESFFLIALDQSNTISGWAKLGMGSITGCMVDLRILTKIALESLAVRVLLAHNHPSGNLKPSQADISLTEKIKKGLGVFDIGVLDHVITTEHSHFSFADNGLI